MLLITNCSQLVTMRGPKRPRIGVELRELSIIHDGAMLVEGGRIARVGTRAEIEPTVDATCQVVDATGRVVLPGFVDAHAHPVFAGNRVDEYEQRALGATYQEIAEHGGGIRSTVQKTRAATQDQLVESSKRYTDWFLRSGTTTLEAKSGYGLTPEDELKILRAIRRLNDETSLGYVPTFLGAHDIPDEYRDNREGYVELVIEEMIPHVAGEQLAKFCDVFCEKSVFTIDESRRILLAAKASELGLRMHADQLSLSGGAKLAAELGAVTADHLEHTDRNGIEALKQSGVLPVLLPGSVYALGSSRYPAARSMIDAGLAIVLATDFNPGSSPTPSIPMILSLASTHMKMTPAEGLTATTINAAYSLGLGDDRGSLEQGKRADFVIHDSVDFREIAYFFGVEHACETYVEGRLAFTRNTFTTPQHSG